MFACQYDFTGRVVCSPGVMWFLRKGSGKLRREFVRVFNAALRPTGARCLVVFMFRDLAFGASRAGGGVFVRFMRENNYPNFRNRRNCYFWELDMENFKAEVPAFEIERGTGLALGPDGKSMYPEDAAES